MGSIGLIVIGVVTIKKKQHVLPFLECCVADTVLSTGHLVLNETGVPDLTVEQSGPSRAGITLL